MSNQKFPPLEDLISEINHKIEKYPASNAVDEYGSNTKDTHRYGKRRGNQYIRFSIQKKHFALPLEYTLEITSKPAVTLLPNLPGWILGICNVRGEIVSVVDLARLLRIEQSNFFYGSHLMLIQIGNMKTGLLVDKIRGIFFDSDPALQIEKKTLSDVSFSEFAINTFVSSQCQIHLLEVAKLLPILKKMH